VAPDLTSTEAHERAVRRLAVTLAFALQGRAAVFSEIFLRVGGRQVPADLFVVPGISAGTRTVYRVPDEPVPTITFEVLSEANRSGRGRRELEGKRALFAASGVPRHVEIDLDASTLSLWDLDGGTLRRVAEQSTLVDEVLGGVVIGLPEPGVLDIVLPDGRLLGTLEEEMAWGQQQAEKAERLAERLRSLGVDPDSI
jgi:hypothetical protein